jgi:hypothetical protein
VVPGVGSVVPGKFAQLLCSQAQPAIVCLEPSVHLHSIYRGVPQH